MRKTGLIAAGLALTLTLVGCGSKEGGSPTAGPDGGSAGDVKLFGNALDLAGAINDKSKSKQSAKMTFEGGAAGQTMKGDGAFKQDGTEASMKMKMEMPGMGAMEMVFLKKVLYMKMPAELASTAGMSTDKPWIKISSEGTDPISKMIGPMLESMGDSFDVSKQVEQIKDAGEITKSAKETLDGAEVTHYWIKVDMLKLVEAQKNPELKKALETEAKNTPTVESELWLNTDNLPVKMTQKIPAGGQTVEMTVKYTDWGQPVEITAPPESQIGTLPGN